MIAATPEKINEISSKTLTPISFETAVWLKDLGFDWPTSFYYNEFNHDERGILHSKVMLENPSDRNVFVAPVQEQVQKWLRQFNIFIEVSMSVTMDGQHVFKSDVRKSNGHQGTTYYVKGDYVHQTYEDALEKALFKAIEFKVLGKI